MVQIPQIWEFASAGRCHLPFVSAVFSNGARKFSGVFIVFSPEFYIDWPEQPWVMGIDWNNMAAVSSG
jgi:hypothetical protein